MRRVKVLVASLLFLHAARALAGGVMLHHPVLDGRAVSAGSGPLLLAPGATARLCFDLEGYAYSGKPHEVAYVVFGFVRKESSSPPASVFVKPLEGLGASSTESGEFTIQHCVAMTAPSTPGDFSLRYCNLLLFPSDAGRARFDDFELPHFGLRHFQRNAQITAPLLPALRVTHGAAVADDAPFSTYLRLNGTIPGTGSHIDPGIGGPAPVFSWHVKGAQGDVEHKYRLYPVEAEWSPWTSDTQATYFYVAAGAHQFQVVSRVRSPGGGWVEGRQAAYQFFLERPLIAAPLTKASAGVAGPKAAAIDRTSLYGKSRALLIGVTQYDDKSFGPLPFIDGDLKQMDATLRAVGFSEVETLKGALTRAKVAEAIETFARGALKGERLVVYFSTHGISDDLDKSRAFVVTTDCHPKQPSSCLGLQELDAILQPVVRAESAPIRHLLVLLDTCSSGLGVIEKSGRYNELTVAAKSGAHLMTAGLADQQAEQDPGLGMSTFTYYLTEGLGGKADYTQDGVVSLSELLVYVRYGVAQRTAGRQTPMIGRLAGSGEMIFWR